MALTESVLKEFLDQKAEQYNNPKFVEEDPIQIPKMFSKKEDIEISAFLTATISWGNRKSIIKNAKDLMERMENSPFDFIQHSQDKDHKNFEGFVHRTFNQIDAISFIKSLQQIYNCFGGLEKVIQPKKGELYMHQGISRLRKKFFEIELPLRVGKHFSNPEKGSAAKRLHMFLRWMIRSDNNGVDFGIWNSISPSKLSCPLYVHTGKTARLLGLVFRKQNDLKTVYELDERLRKFDKHDPVKYDFALFGLGAYEIL